MIRYLPLGDSYTIGEGAAIHENWPSLLTQSLNNHNIPVELVANPAVTGWTTYDLIRNELKYIDQLKPDFITVLIGVNDWVQGVSRSTFEFNYRYILEYCLQHLKNKQHLLSITIPDFGVTPDGRKYSYGRDITQGLQSFNNAIKAINKEFDIHTVDIFPVSRRMNNEPEMVANDHIHGSATMYAVWEKIILPETISILKK